MAKKVGEAYYEIFPKLNDAAFAAARRALGESLSKEFAKAQSEMRASSTATAEKQINDIDRVNQYRSASNKQAISEAEKLRNIRTAGVSDVRNEEKRLNQDRTKADKVQTSQFHSLATQLRTVGTIARGVVLPAAFTAAIQVVEGSIGLINESLPIFKAGLADLPTIIGSMGVEALILKGAFRGVGTAIRDSQTNTAQFQKDLAKLNPEARKFTVSIVNAMKQLPNLQKNVFGAQTLQAAEGNLGHFFRFIRTAVGSVEKSTGGLLGSILGNATSGQGARDINTFLKGLNQSLINLTPGIDRVTLGLLHMMASGSGQGAKGLNTVLEHIGDFLSKIDVAKLFSKAGDAVHHLIPIFKDFGTVVRQGFDDITGGSKGTARTFDRFGAFLKQSKDWITSGTGKAFMQTLGQAVNSISGAALALFAGLLAEIARLLVIINPGLKPLFQAIAGLRQALQPLIPIIGHVLLTLIQIATVIIRDVTPAISGLVHLLANNQSIVEAFVVALIAGGAAFKVLKSAEGLIKTFKELYLGLKILIPVLGTVDAEANANPFGVIAIGVAALAVGIFLLIKHFKQVVAFLRGPWGTAILVVSQGLFGFLSLFILVGLHWQQIWRFMLRVLHDVWSGMYHEVFAPMADTFTKRIPSWMHTLERLWGDCWNFLKRYSHDAWVFIWKEVIIPIRDTFTRLIPGWFKSFRHSTANIFDGVRGDIHSWWSDMVNFFTSKVKGFFIDTIPGWAGKLASKVSGFFRGLAQNVINAGADIANAIATPINWIVNHVYHSGIHRLWNDIAHPLHLPQLPDFQLNLHFGAADSLPPVGGPTTASSPRKGFSAGGPVLGFGGPTEDNIAAALSAGEYVINKKSVDQIGVPYLNLLNNIGGDPSGAIVGARFAGGGLVGAAAKAPHAESPLQVLQFLRSIAGTIPYIFGAVGPTGYDCSGLVGEVWARLTGHPSFRRYFVTGDEQSFLTRQGFQKGGDPSGFTVGFSNEHTVGILGGHRFEAAHTGTKMRLDDGATNALSMPHVMHLGGFQGSLLTGILGKIVQQAGQMASYFAPALRAAKATPNQSIPFNKGAASYGVDLVNSAAGQAQSALTAQVNAMNAALNSTALGSFSGVGNASQIQKWIAMASKYTSIPPSWVPGIETIIKRESGGNPNAVNRTDINAMLGHPSEGLMQVIGPTFEAFRNRSLPNNQFDPVANIVAAVNYIRGRYGSIFQVQQANPNLPPKGYAAGGPVLVRDQGGPVYPGMNHIWNGTGHNEWVVNEEQSGFHGDVYVVVDGVAERATTYVDQNNKRLVHAVKRVG